MLDLCIKDVLTSEFKKLDPTDKIVFIADLLADATPTTPFVGEYKNELTEIRETVEDNKKPENLAPKKVGRGPIVVLGKQYKSLRSACIELDQKYATVIGRKAKGYSIEEMFKEAYKQDKIRQKKTTIIRRTHEL